MKSLLILTLITSSATNAQASSTGIYAVMQAVHQVATPYQACVKVEATQGLLGKLGCIDTVIESGRALGLSDDMLEGVIEAGYAAQGIELDWTWRK
ncbi:MAG: hypothetical protein RLZZ381_1838 [Cyanobacteriota bacterium]|jgi:hypothetical protein